MDWSLTLLVDRSLTSLALASAALRGVCVETLTDPAAQSAAETGLAEAVLNAIQHGGAADDDRIRLAIRVTTEWLEVVLMETGPPFDFDGCMMPDLEVADPRLLPETGFGIPLIKSTMDVAEYRHEWGTNILRLAKRRTGASREARR